MNDSFFKSKDLPEPESLLIDFEFILSEMTDTWGDKYLNSFNQNSKFFESWLPGKDYEFLTKVFSIFFLRLKDETNFQSPTYFAEKAVFHEKDKKYKEWFRIKAKPFFETLKMLPNKKVPDEEKKYFRKFLITTTFFCANYGYKFQHSLNSESVIIKTNENSNLKSVERFYLFYNRSQNRSEKIGIGSVEITDRRYVNIEYYYSAEPEFELSPTGDHGIQKASGTLSEVKESSIWIIRNVIDKPTEAQRNKNTGLVENHFVIKQYDQKDEKILLGTSVWWNRRDNYPCASAIVLIEAGYYDRLFSTHPDFGFKHIKANRTNESIPPEIFYYLFHQIVSLEPILSNVDKNKKSTSFSELEQIPFYKGNGEVIKILKGKYKGLSIVNNNETDILIISELEIFPNGLVNLLFQNSSTTQPMAERPTLGFIKEADVDNMGRGKIVITLRYDYDKHTNLLDYYLEFDDLFKKEKEGEKGQFWLRGGFAGISRISHNPTASCIVFESQPNDKRVNIQHIKLIESEKENTTEVLRLYEENPKLFDIFRKSSRRYSNYSGVKILTSILDHKTDTDRGIAGFTNDIFISIPLSYNHNAKEYERNCSIAKELKEELIHRYNFDPDRIFCSCFNKNKKLAFQEYEEYKGTSLKGFKEVRKEIDESKILIFVYPKPYKSKDDVLRISSAVVEIGYALGMKKDVIILYDKSEKENMPKNLMRLNESRSFDFDTNQSRPIHKMFSYMNYEEQITRIIKKTSASTNSNTG